jgi:hypothetical protein
VDQGYLTQSKRPWPVLVFLVPLIALYEVGSLMFLWDRGRGVIETIGARGILGEFFEAFGVVSLHVPAVLLVTVLMLWHLMLRDPWKIRPSTLLGMALESVLWTMPLLVLAALLAPGPAMTPAMALQGGQSAIEAMPWQARLTLSAGAGLYEELLFRLMLITLVHMVLVDLLKLPSSTAYVVAAVLSAVTFAFYHNIAHPGGGADMRLLTFYALAGLYFAALFILRGFGIVVMAHALYDVVVLLR